MPTRPRPNSGEHLAIGLDIAEGAHPSALDALLAGAYDAEIDHLRQLFGHVRGVVFLRIGYVFDGAWNAGYRDAERFAAAFRYIDERVRATGRATNARFVSQASASPIGDILDGKRDDISAGVPATTMWTGSRTRDFCRVLPEAHVG